jgi:hypothetical protein
MKNILFTITLLASASAFAMEAPPQAPVKVVAARPLLPLKGLPADIQRKLFPLCMEGNLYEVAETILAFAGTNKENQAYVNDNMIMILESFSHTAKAIEIYKLLQNKIISLPVMQKPPMKAWFENAKNSLGHREALSRAFGIWDPKNSEQIKELFQLKNLDLNNIKGENNFTLLCFEAYCGGPSNKIAKERMLLLLKAGANPNIAANMSNFKDKNPLFYSALVSDEEAGAILLEWGANPDNVRNDFYDRALEGRPEMALLVEAASLARKQRVQERRKKLYGAKLEFEQKTALSCAML